MDTNRVQRNPIRWSDFPDRVRERRELGFRQTYPRIFRGQPNADWRLQTLAERRINHIVRRYDQLVSGYLEPFKARALPQLGMDGRLLQIEARLATRIETEKEWWALGRHYGLVTPLLDWTRSPYVAAFFAFAEQAENEYVTVWALDTNPLHMWKDGEFEYVDHPSAINARQRAQQGVFTFKVDTATNDLESYLSFRNVLDRLERFDMPREDASAALHDLLQMNVTFSSLFPDLNGAANEANLGGRYASLFENPNP